MSRNNLIELHCFGREIGKLGFDEDRNATFFQYNPAVLKEAVYTNLFPLIFKKISPVQVFDKYNNPTFKGLPPMIADSLPDMFGNRIFKLWLDGNNKTFSQISPLEQLSYVGKRGMGALEYHPSKELGPDTTINLDEIIELVQLVLDNKKDIKEQALNETSLLNIFKVGSTAGGARPKILISENKKTGEIIPGDLEHSAAFNHYLIKLDIDENLGYSRETIEYAYYLTATGTGISMMPSRLIENKHFATLRFDRIEGRKKHVLTATGIAGLDFIDPNVSSYENLFNLAIYLKLPHRDIEQLFRRMIFNLVFANHDDHLKNHAFIYDENTDKWELAPAYDLTYSLNPLLNITRQSRALSINGKRTNLTIADILTIAEAYTIKNPRAVITEINHARADWNQHARMLNIPQKITEGINNSFIDIK